MKVKWKPSFRNATVDVQYGLSGCVMPAPCSHLPVTSVSLWWPFSLPQRRINVHPRAYVVVAQQARLGGQGIVSENGIVIR